MIICEAEKEVIAMKSFVRSKPLKIKSIRGLQVHEIKDVIRANNGILSSAARELREVHGCNITREQLQREVEKNPALRNVLQDGLERMKDAAMDVIAKSLEKGDIDTAKFVMKMTGQDRGFKSSDNVTNVTNINPVVLVDDL